MTMSRFLPAVIVLLTWAGALMAPAPASAGTPMPEIPQGEGDQCVEPTPVMRRAHFEFILHQRDETMHKGIRTTKHSLKGCIDCHAQKDDSGEYIPVNAPGQFCATCHSYTAVKIDCWQCHATTPGGSQRYSAAADPHSASD
jgi:hypothetical protein